MYGDLFHVMGEQFSVSIIYGNLLTYIPDKRDYGQLQSSKVKHQRSQCIQ